MDPAIEDISRVREATKAWSRVAVHGGPGTDYFDLAASVADDPKFVEVHAPDLAETDSALHVLMQIAARLDAHAVDLTQTESTSLKARTTAVLDRFPDDQTLVLELPPSWRDVVAGYASTPDRAERQRDARDLLHGVFASTRGRLVVVSQFSHFLAESVAPGHMHLVRLATHAASKETTSPSSWGTYATVASPLLAALAAAKATPPRVHLALGVAALGIGFPLAPVAAALRADRPPIEPLERCLTHAVENAPELASRLGRLATARFPIPLELASNLSGLPPAHRPLLEHCFVVGGRTRVPAFLRARLPNPDSAAHIELAVHHKASDGADDAPIGRQMFHWLERAHHLAHGGDAGAVEWGKLNRRCRAFYWDRARALSIEQKDYLGAARVYEECIEKFGPDPYSVHYQGFNLDRAARDREAAEGLLRKAVSLEPDNAWWNGRLVTFLIEQARFVAARAEWQRALDNVDPDGTVVRRNPWLAEQLHRWVVRAWLKHGETDLAREAFDTIPLELVEGENGSGKLKQLQENLRDAEEARDLGESVYPRWVSSARRWSAPEIPSPHNAAGSPLRAWYPARVVQGSKDGVIIVLADPATDADGRRRVFVRTLSATEWETAVRTPAPEASGYVQIATFEDESYRIDRLTDLPAPWVEADDPEYELRYLARWESSGAHDGSQ